MKIIIPVFVGAVIGYITNWLAIKMLFRPHEEKRILGFHIPFTPGLIPKERTRIAKSVGETIGSYLLSPEVILNSLSNNKMETYIQEWIQSNIDRLKKDNRSLKDLIMTLTHGNYDRVLSKVKNILVDLVYIEIKKDKFKERLMELIGEHLFNSSMEEVYGFLDGRLSILLSDLSSSKEARNLLKNAIEGKLDELAQDERKLYEVIPEDIVRAIKDFIREKDEEIVHILKGMLEDSQVEAKIKESIRRLVSQNMNTLVAMFISPEIISNKVYTMIKEYLDKSEVKDNIVDILTRVIDRALEGRVYGLFKTIKSNIGEGEILDLSSNILDHILNEKSQREVLNFIGEKLRKQEKELQASILNLLSNRFEELLSSQGFYNNLHELVDNFVDNTLDKPISSTVGPVDDKTVEDISKFSMNIFNYFIVNKLPHILELFNISKVVEDQINSYDVEFTEELILEIANKELKAITWLGALLGGIMGILTPLLQMLY